AAGHTIAAVAVAAVSVAAATAARGAVQVFHGAAIGHPLFPRVARVRPCPRLPGAGSARSSATTAGATAAPGLRSAADGAAGTAAGLEAEAGILEQLIELFIKLAEHLGKAFVEMIEHQRTQATGEVFGTEQADESGHGRCWPHRV